MQPFGLAAEFDAAAAGPGIHEAGEIPMIEVTVDDVVAIILALHTGAPFFVASEMLELPIVVMAGTALDQLEEYVRRKREARNEAPEVPAMAWQRFRSLPRAENPWITGP